MGYAKEIRITSGPITLSVSAPPGLLQYPSLSGGTFGSKRSILQRNKVDCKVHLSGAGAVWSMKHEATDLIWSNWGLRRRTLLSAWNSDYIGKTIKKLRLSAYLPPMESVSTGSCMFLPFASSIFNDKLDKFRLAPHTWDDPYFQKEPYHSSKQPFKSLVW